MGKIPLYSDLTNNGCCIAKNNIKHAVKILGFLLLHNEAHVFTTGVDG